MYKTLIVVDGHDEALGDDLPETISFEKYLRRYPKRDEPKTRIINLCDTTHYLSKGYYCSLLAEARNHSVLPSVKTINELRTKSLEKEGYAPLASIASESADIPSGEFWLYFGKAAIPALQKVATKLFGVYPAPILKLVVRRRDDKSELQVIRYSYASLNEQQRSDFSEALRDFTKTVWRIGARKKRYRWDMAVLVDPSEKVPPSNKEAIARFVKAAAKQGILAEVVSQQQLQNIDHYDALFIRETTAIDHYTYRLACQAENSGIVVMDDPTSILRCCNKIYLHDAFSYQGVSGLKTEIISDGDSDAVEKLESQFAYPFVLKMPEGSFSKGVYKVTNRDELQQRLVDIFKFSDLVLAQEYMYTDFDWRIGVLNGRAIYACRYMMARNHWQIYNHDAKRFFSGGFETLPTFEVPKSVLDAALRSASIVGDGLYGVDIKQKDNHAYVLEVNDNPSIDHKVEDAYLGDELYMQIMGEFHRRLEARGR